MMAVVLTVASAAIAYTIEGALVGALIGASRLRSSRPQLGRGLFFILLAVFASLDLYWIPAVLALDLQLQIGNPRAAAFLGAAFPATDMLSLDWFDMVVWVAQSLIALWVAERISRRAENAI